MIMVQNFIKLTHFFILLKNISLNTYLQLKITDYIYSKTSFCLKLNSILEKKKLLQEE